MLEYKFQSTSIIGSGQVACCEECNEVSCRSEVQCNIVPVV